MKAEKSFRKWCKNNWVVVNSRKDALIIWTAAWKRGAKSIKRSIPQAEPPRS